jgi:WD40 repeat protein
MKIKTIPPLLVIAALVILSLNCGTLDMRLVDVQSTGPAEFTHPGVAATPTVKIPVASPSPTSRTSTAITQPTAEGGISVHGSLSTILDVKGLHVLWSPDGKQLYVGEEKLHVFDAATLAEIRTQKADREVMGLAVSPNGGIFAVNDGSQGVVLYNAAGAELRVLAGTNIRTSTPSNSSLAFTPDNTTLAVVVGDIVKLFDVQSGDEVKTIPAARASIIAVSPDGTSLYTGGSGDDISVWDIATGEKTRSIGEDLIVMRCMALSPDGRTMVTGDTFNGTITLWDTASGRGLRTFEGHTSGVIGLSFSPDGRILASTSQDITIRLWDVATGKAIQTLSGHTQAPGSIAFSPDGSTLVSGSTDGTTRLWSISEGEPAAAATPTASGPGADLRPTPIPLSGRAISTENAALVKKLSGLGASESETAVFSPDGKWLVLAGRKLHFLDAGTFEEVRTVGYAMDGLAVSPDSRILATVGNPGIMLFDLATGDELLTIPRTNATTSATSNGFLAFSPDSATLAAVVGNVVKLYDTSSGAEKGTIVAAMAYNIALSPDGRFLYASGWAGNITVWDTTSGQQIRDFGLESLAVNRMALSPDGSLLASVGTFYGSIILWNTATGHQARTLEGHSDSVTSLAFSPDGKLLISASRDVTIRLWDTATGKSLATLVGHTQAPDFVAVHPDGATLASASRGDGIYLWGLPAG